MKVLGKTLSYWKELYGGIIAGLIVSIFIYWLKPITANWIDFIKAFPTIGMCAFGFLLTFLSIILQGNSEAITWMKSRKNLFRRFVVYNKRIVIVSFYLSISSYGFGFVKFELLNNIFNLTAGNYLLIQQVLIALFAGGATWLIIDTVCFIHIFYSLIKEDK